MFVTRCVSYSKDRRPTAEEASKELSELILLCERPILCDNRPRADTFFIGREKELSKIEEELCTKRGVCVHGTGGIGKSELVRHFAESWQGTVVFLQCNGSIKNMLISGVCIRGVDLTKRAEHDALAQIAAAVNENTLLVADNIDDIDNVKEELDLILRLNCKLLVTTRLDSEKFNVLSKIPLLPMPMDELMTIFETNYNGKKLGESERNAAEECLRLCGELPLMAVLLAKQMTASRIAPKKMLAALKKTGVSALGEESVEFGTRTEENATSILRALFDMSKLNKAQLKIMAIMALAPVRGFDIELVMKWSNQKNYNTINSMKRLGWLNIEYLEEHEYVVMHPLVSQVTLTFLEGRAKCGNKSVDPFTTLRIQIRNELEGIGDYYSLISVAEKERVFENNTGQSSYKINNYLARCYSDVNRYADAEQCLLDIAAEFMELSLDDDYCRKEIRKLYFKLYETALAQEKYESCLEYLDKARSCDDALNEEDYFVRRCEIIGRRDGKERQTELLYEELCAADEQPERKSRKGFGKIVIAYIDALLDLGQTEKARADAEKYIEEAVRMQYVTLEIIMLYTRFPDSDAMKKRLEALRKAGENEHGVDKDFNDDYFGRMIEGEYEKAEILFNANKDWDNILQRYYFLLAIRFTLLNNSTAYTKAIKVAEHAYGCLEKLVPSNDEEFAFKVRAKLVSVEIRMCFLYHLTNLSESLSESEKYSSLAEWLDALLPDNETRWQHDIDSICSAMDALNELNSVHCEIAWAYIHTACDMIVADMNENAEDCLKNADRIAEQLGNTTLSEVVWLVRILLSIMEERCDDAVQAINDFLKPRNRSVRKQMYNQIGGPILFVVCLLGMDKRLDKKSLQRLYSDIMYCTPKELTDAMRGMKIVYGY